MLFDGTVVILMMKMSVVEVIDMVAVLDRGVSTPLAVLMRVLFFADLLFFHDFYSLARGRHPAILDFSGSSRFVPLFAGCLAMMEASMTTVLPENS